MVNLRSWDIPESKVDNLKKVLLFGYGIGYRYGDILYNAMKDVYLRKPEKSLDEKVLETYLKRKYKIGGSKVKESVKVLLDLGVDKAEVEKALGELKL